MRSSRGRRSWANGVLLIAPLALVAALSGRAATDLRSPGLVWSLPLTSALAAPPTSDGRSVYLPLRSGRVVSLAAADGRLRWEAEVPAIHAVAIGMDQVFAATADEVVSLDADTGAIGWRLPAPGVTTAPAFRAGWLLAGTSDGSLVAVAASTGTVVWRAALGAPLSSPVTIDGERVYAPLDDGGVVAIDITTGRTLWRAGVGPRAGAITAAGDRLYLGSTDNFFYSLDANDGRRRWRWRTGADVVGAAAVDAARVYFVSLDNVVRALDAESGVLRWSSPLDSRPLAGPVLDGDVLVLSVLGTALPVIRTADGKPAGSWRAPGELAQPPVVFSSSPGLGAAPGLVSWPGERGDRSPPSVRGVIVTGSDVGEWRVYGLGPSIEPAPARLTEPPGRPLPPSGPPAPRAAPPPGGAPLP